MSVASVPTASSETASPPEARRTLLATGVNHALHDGYTDLIYVLLPAPPSRRPTPSPTRPPEGPAIA